MKCFVFVLFCIAGYAHAQINQACDSNTPCSEGFECQSSKCKAKIGTNCATKDSGDECVTGAAPCPANNSPCRCPADQISTDSVTCSACTAPQIPNADANKCVSKVDGTCTTVDDATQCIAGATCKAAQSGGGNSCQCLANSVASSTKEVCLKYIGQTCAADGDCVTNGRCDNKKCACKENYMASDDKAACKKALSQACNGNGDCGINAVCNTQKCACDNNYYNENGRCGLKVGQACSDSSQCVMNAMCPTTGEKKCKCDTKFTEDDGLCKSGAKGLIASLVLLMTALVTSRLI